jgi:hypothetical protein
MIFGETWETDRGSEERFSSAANVVCVVMQKSAVTATAFLRMRLGSDFMGCSGLG